MLEQHMDMRLEAAMGEHDDGMLAFARRSSAANEFRCARGDAGVPDPLRDELSIRGEDHPEPESDPARPVPARQDAVHILERAGWISLRVRASRAAM